MAYVSIAFDNRAEQTAAIAEFGLPASVPLLIDADQSVSKAYDVLKWAVRSGEPSHTFILVDQAGKVVWIKDYGSPNLPNPTMYVEPTELVGYIQQSLAE